MKRMRRMNHWKALCVAFAQSFRGEFLGGEPEATHRQRIYNAVCAAGLLHDERRMNPAMRRWWCEWHQRQASWSPLFDALIRDAYQHGFQHRLAVEAAITKEVGPKEKT